MMQFHKPHYRMNSYFILDTYIHTYIYIYICPLKGNTPQLIGILSHSGSDLGSLHEGFLGRRVVEDEHHHLRCKRECETLRHALLHSLLDLEGAYFWTLHKCEHGCTSVITKISPLATWSGLGGLGYEWVGDEWVGGTTVAE